MEPNPPSNCSSGTESVRVHAGADGAGRVHGAGAITNSSALCCHERYFTTENVTFFVLAAPVLGFALSVILHVPALTPLTLPFETVQIFFVHVFAERTAPFGTVNA